MYRAYILQPHVSIYVTPCDGSTNYQHAPRILEPKIPPADDRHNQPDSNVWMPNKIKNRCSPPAGLLNLVAKGPLAILFDRVVLAFAHQSALTSRPVECSFSGQVRSILRSTVREKRQNMSISVLIVDDHAIVRSGLRSMLGRIGGRRRRRSGRFGGSCKTNRFFKSRCRPHGRTHG